MQTTKLNEFLMLLVYITLCSLGSARCASQEVWLTRGGLLKSHYRSLQAKFSLRQVDTVFSAQGCYYSLNIITQLMEISLKKGRELRVD